MSNDQWPKKREAEKNNRTRGKQKARQEQGKRD
jgi:hypothetical protein